MFLNDFFSQTHLKFSPAAFFFLFFSPLLKLPFISICKVLKNILQMLGGGDMSGSHIEFGTVLIWTCRQSCWASGDYVREERVVVQAERF